MPEDLEGPRGRPAAAAAAPGDETPPAPPAGGLVLAATTAVQMVLTSGTLVLPAVAPEAATALDLDPMLVGVQVSVVYGGAMLTALTAAQLVRRLGGCRVSQLSLLCLCAGCLLAAIPSIVAVAAGSVLMGFGYGLPNPAAAHLLVRFTDPRRRGLIFSVKQAGVPLGGAVVGVAAPPLALMIGWQAPLIATAAVAAALAAVLQVARTSWDADRRPEATLEPAALLASFDVLRLRPVFGLALAMLFLAAIQLCVSSFAVIALVDELGFHVVTAGSVLSAALAASMCGRILWGWLADRTGSGHRVLVGLVLGITAGALAIAALGPTTPPALTVAAFVFLGATAIGWNGVLISETVRLSPPGRVADATSALMAMSYLGVLIGPLSFVAAARGLGGIIPAFHAVAAVSLLALGALWLPALQRRIAGPPQLPGA